MNDALELTANPNATTALAVIAPVNVDALDTAKPLVEIFAPYQSTLEKWEAKAKSLVVSDLSQLAEMKMARVARLELKEARVEMDKTRKGLVEHLKLRTSKIDGTARIIREKIESLEEILLMSEQFAERHAAKVKAELKASREAELTPFLDCPLVVDLSDLSDEAYAGTLWGAKQVRQAKIDAAAKAEADRKAKEEADRLERERIAAENARLRAEAEATAKRLEEEHKAREAQAAKERAAQEVERKRIEAIHAEEVKRLEADRLAEEWRARKEREAIQAAADVEMKKAAALRLAEMKKANEERAKIQAVADEIARKASAETERLKAELEAKRKAEADAAAVLERERKAQVLEAKRAAAAPDRAKLQSLAMRIREVPIPDLSNTVLFAEIWAHRESFAAWIESRIEGELL